jgi:hypothetical protein
MGAAAARGCGRHGMWYGACHCRCCKGVWEAWCVVWGLSVQVLQGVCGAASIWETVIFLACLGNNIPIHLGHLIFPTSSGK